MTRLFSAAICYALIFVALIAVLLANAPPARGHSNPWLLTWIPWNCCVTHDCCREITEKDVTSLPDDYWRINASGQVLRRTAASPDGKWYRCACDWNTSTGKWVVHPQAHTRCFFAPDLGS